LVTSVSEEELLSAQVRGDRAGLFVDPHTAAALAGLEHLARDGVVGEDATCVVVSTAHALKFVEQKARFHEGNEPLPEALASLRNPPALVEASVAAVERVLAERLPS